VHGDAPQQLPRGGAFYPIWRSNRLSGAS